MTLIPVIEEFDEIAKQIPRIVRLLEEGSLDFTACCIKLIEEYVALSEKRNMRFAADMALIKGRALTYIDSGGITTTENRKQKKKARESHMIQCLNEAYSLARRYFESDNTCLKECDGTIRQVLAAASANKMLPAKDETADDQRLMTVWGILKNSPELSPAITHIIGLAGIYNAQILLDRNLAYFT